MPIVKIDEKGRIRLPREIRKVWHLRPRQPLLVEIRGGVLSVHRARKVEPSHDPLLHDILRNPGRSRVRLTRKLLLRLKDETWSP